MKIRLLFVVLAISFATSADLGAQVDRAPMRAQFKTHLLPVREYHDKVYASFLGQMVGNFYGLGYEFKFIDKPGPDSMPYGYSRYFLGRLKELNGGFSDDDTDFEYMYLLQMEKWGVEPTYRQLAEAWKFHIRKRVWVANRVALTLMHTGLSPPHTGRKKYNGKWFQIDPQLVNEIWAVTAPGMVEYATAKSDWAARITSDDFGVEPTIHYGAMYAAAFFEKDVERLVDIGLQALPADSRFAQTINFVKRLVDKHPHDWQAARRELADRYYGEFDYNQGAWAAVDANLNGACGIMALLYGQGDFQKTLDMACGLGFDADNQAATMCGLLGLANGLESIPNELLFPVKNADWAKPFNDQYLNVTRHGLPDARISDLAKRMAIQGEQVLLSQGGERLKIDEVEYYRVPEKNRFVPPFELNPPPVLRGGIGEAVEFEFYTGRPLESVKWKLQGELPRGLTFSSGTLRGVFQDVGESRFTLVASSDGQQRTTYVDVQVRGKNLALGANEVLFNSDSSDRNVSILRDGDRRKTFYSVSNHSKPKTDFYGYTWSEPKRISALRYSVGQRTEWGGWFTSLNVEYKHKAGEWKRVENLKLNPVPNLDNSQWLKTSRVDYDLSFTPVEATAVRIIGSAGGIRPDAVNQYKGTRYFTAISELSVYEK